MAKKKKVVFKQKGPKDDGSRWSIFRNEVQVYRGDGLKKADADRICSGLVTPATVKMVVPPDEES